MVKAHIVDLYIAIVPTACGIETVCEYTKLYPRRSEIAIVPTACGIETHLRHGTPVEVFWHIAIVPTACGIETIKEIRDMIINC